ncbi:MAG: ABC transporter permease [Candidatus Acidiferrales bacterium]
MAILDPARRELFYAFRTLKKQPTFAITAIAILALGIGAQTAVFSLVNGILLKPLTYCDPGQLYAVSEVIPQLSNQYPRLPVNGNHYLQWTRHCETCDGIVLVDTTDMNLSGREEPERIVAERVTSNYFSVLGVPVQLGRSFGPDDAKPGQDTVALISNGLWQRKFGGNPGIVGQAVTLNDQSFTVIGVLPVNFRSPAWPMLGPGMSNHADVFRPWVMKDSDFEEMGSFNYGAIVRLKPGVAEAKGAAELNVLQAQIASRLKGDDKMDLAVELSPLRQIETAQSRGALLLLLGAIGAVLLIVCVNLGNLMLVRAFGQMRATAVRIALGATRGRVLGGIIAESLLLALAGGALALGLAYALIRLFISEAPVELPRLREVTMDWRVLAFALGAAVFCGLFFSILPAFKLMRTDPQEAMRVGGRGATESGGRMRVRDFLVSAEVTLSCVLLILAGLLIRSFVRVAGVNRGFEVQHILTARIAPSYPRYEDDQKRLQLYKNIAAKLSERPGVLASGLTSILPLTGDSWTDIISLPGDTRPMIQRPIASYRVVSPGYLEVMGVKLMAGRFPQANDEPRRLVVVSQRTAETVWPGQNVVGEKFGNSSDDTKDKPYEVIGVAGDARMQNLEEAGGMVVYVPYWVRPSEAAAIAVRTAGNPLKAAGEIREAVRSADSQLPISDMETMTRIVQKSLGQRQFETGLVVLFACSALLLAGLGIYSVLAFGVARRTNEIGVRIALGAQPANILKIVMIRGLVPVALGLGVGIVAAIATGKLLSGMLFSVRPYDPVTIAGVTVLTIAAAMAACWLPARRATRIDPLEALRYE